MQRQENTPLIAVAGLGAIACLSPSTSTSAC